MMEPGNKHLTISRQCELLEFPQATYYFQPKDTNEEDLELMLAIDKYHMDNPAFGSRTIAKDFGIGRQRARRLMRVIGIETIYPKPKTTEKNKEHEIYPYLLRGVEITRPNHVWSTDITCIPMAHGFVYLTVVIDWYSRSILPWRLSNTMEKSFCIEALEKALSKGAKPEIFNMDQGTQYTNSEFMGLLNRNEVRISMDG